MCLCLNMIAKSSHSLQGLSKTPSIEDPAELRLKETALCLGHCGHEILHLNTLGRLSPICPAHGGEKGKKRTFWTKVLSQCSWEGGEAGPLPRGVAQTDAQRRGGHRSECQKPSEKPNRGRVGRRKALEEKVENRKPHEGRRGCGRREAGVVRSLR